uniref:Uncharacterized protein n=1 Tax=Meloidogyne incognita TaxID=6306 RepID=A0A914N7B9_MELIC
MNDTLFSIKTFNYVISKPGFQQTISYDFQIPLAENSLGSDFFGHLFAKQKVPLFAFENALNNFVYDETNKCTSLIADELLREKLAQFGDDSSKLALELNNDKLDGKHSIGLFSKGELSFEEQFQKLINKCSTHQLANLIKEETEMTNDVRSIVHARDFELNRLEKACEASLLATSTPDSDKFDEYSRELSKLNAEIRRVGADFSCRMEELRQYQREKYRSLVKNLSQNVENSLLSTKRQIPEKKMSTPEQHSSSLNYSPSCGFQQQFTNKNLKSLKKSISCEEKISQLCLGEKGNKSSFVGRQSESFSIYIGSQLKTRHNVRLLTCNCLSDLCLSQTFEDFPHQEELLGSKRLHLLMNLYGRELSATVLIVGRDPLWHIKQKTEFAKLCEQSAELHFDSLEGQLKAIEEHVRSANRSRRLAKNSIGYTSPFFPYFSSSQQDFEDDNEDEGILKIGDVYLTKHSNLSSVQIIFHLVGDDKLEKEEISSRHPCVAGLHNIVRLSSRFAIRNISLPLLLVDQFNDEFLSSENININIWCQSRAELVFKCLKGFLMEVCSSGSSCSLAGGANSGPIQSLHFNINFAITFSKLLPDSFLFQQLTDLFTSIYYLVPSLNA